ncbi:MAG: T9SS type A sorting domain-containing protein [Bacteroidetes bacterium]|nr:T9SS type A sorting domain-containing protein [Bacteroidota bacterium]
MVKQRCTTPAWSLLILLLCSSLYVQAQSILVLSCPTLDRRNNGNGQYTSSAGDFRPAYSQNNPVAPNVVGTPYQLVPFNPSAKTGTLSFIWTAAANTNLPVITRVWLTASGATSATLSPIQFGPPPPPTQTGGTFVVPYSFYGQNMPPSGKVTLEFSDPQTGQALFICTYDLGNNNTTAAPTISCSPTFTTQPATQILCAAATASFSAAVTGASATQWQVSTDGASWTNVTNGGNYSGATAATLTIANPTTYDGYYYRVYATAASGCRDTFSTSAQLIAKPLPTAVFQDTAFCGTGTRSMRVNLSGSSPWSVTYTAAVSGGGTTTTTLSNVITNPFYFSVSPSATTIYTITSVSDQYCSNSGPAGTVRSTISAVPAISPSNATTCYGSGSFGLAYTATQSPDRYTLTAGTRAMPGFSTISNASLSASPLSITIPANTPAGVYDFNIAVSNSTSSCSAAAVPFTVTVVSNPTVAATAGSGSACAGSTITLTAAPSGLSSYAWSLSPSTSVIATGATASVTLSATSTYTVTATNASGCTATASVSVTALSGPSLTVTGGATICSGNAIRLTASGGSSYTWTPSTGLSATTGSSVVASPSSTTTYTVSSQDTSSCRSTGTVTVTVNTPTIAVTSSATICSGSIKTLTATGGSTYYWYPTTGLYTDAGATTAYTGTSVATVYAKPTASTTYYVVDANASGCSATASSTVSLSASPVNTATSTASNVIFCTQGTTSFVLRVYMSPAVVSSTWYYSTNASSYTNVTSTTAITGVTLTPYAGTDSASMTLSGYGNSGYTGAKYFRLVMTGASCTYSYDIFITDTKSTATSPAPTATSTTICNGNSVTMSIGNLASGSTAQWQSSPDSTTWTNITGATASTYTATPSSSTYYRVVYNGGTGNCGSTSSKILITVASALSANTLSPASTCSDGRSTISLSGSAITGGIFQWQSSTTSSAAGFADVLGATSQNYTLPTNIVSTTTWYRRVASTSICATNTSTAVVVYPPISNNQITTNDTAFCGTAPAITLSGSTPAGGNGTYTYQWMSSSNGTTFSNIGGGTSISNTTSSSSQTLYYKRIVSSGGCLDTTYARTVKVNSNPSISLTSGSTICAGTAVALTAAGALTYGWSPGTELSSTTGSSVTATPTSTRTYTVTGTNGYGCTASASVTLTTTALPATPGLTSSAKTICSGTVNLTSQVSSGSGVQWYTAPQASPTYSVSTPTAVSAAGTYYAYASSSGCYSSGYATFTLTLANVAAPAVAASSLSYCAPATADLTSLQPAPASNTTLEWHTVSSSPSAGNLVATPSAVGSGTYYLYAYSSAGSCYGTASAAVGVTINATSSATVSSTSVSVCAPATVNLNDYNTTSGTNTYTWYTSSTPSPSTRVLYPTQISQSGSYYLMPVSAAGCQGTMSPAVNVAINTSPSAAISSPDAYCGAVSRTITATTNAVSPTYQWQSSSDDGLTWSTLADTAPYSGATTSALTINPTTGLSGMYYRYIVTNGGGCSTTSSPAVLVQETLPTIVGNPQDTMINAGSTVYLDVQVSGSTSLDYQWRVSADSGTTYTALSDNASYKGVNTPTLAIVNSSSAFNGLLYQVVISNSCVTLSSSAARIAFSTSTPLPVTWLYFVAQRAGTDAALTWATASEINSRDFVVQRSADAQEWKDIADVQAAGNSNKELTYTYNDQHPLAGVSYYRIQQRDIDGDVSYSILQAVDFGKGLVNTVVVYPNPVKDGHMNIALDKAGPMTIYNDMGKQVYTGDCHSGTQSINVDGLSKGLYQVRTEEGSLIVDIE